MHCIMQQDEPVRTSPQPCLQPQHPSPQWTTRARRQQCVSRHCPFVHSHQNPSFSCFAFLSFVPFSFLSFSFFPFLAFFCLSKLFFLSFSFFTFLCFSFCMRYVSIRLTFRTTHVARNCCQPTVLSVQALLSTLNKPMLQHIICVFTLATTECMRCCASIRVSIVWKWRRRHATVTTCRAQLV